MHATSHYDPVGVITRTDFHSSIGPVRVFVHLAEIRNLRGGRPHGPSLPRPLDLESLRRHRDMTIAILALCCSYGSIALDSWRVEEHRLMTGPVDASNRNKSCSHFTQ